MAMDALETRRLHLVLFSAMRFRAEASLCRLRDVLHP